ncbi:4-hydroxy-3-methylbut-2-enyl diphosphate reductase [bacterium]|nr:4-hydroxy-3-methylbut-2-enyl diphosphate reductase [bacterium]
MEIHLAHTQGFCAGVASAIEVVNRALAKYGTPLYVRHHIVHNTAVIKDFEDQGVVFIEELSEVPEGGRVIFSAHGVSPTIYEEAKSRQLIYIDATCPLVMKVHREATSFSAKNIQTVLIGHRGHQELVGTSGYVSPDLLHVVETEEDIDRLELDTTIPTGYLTQTTLSVTDTARLIEKLKDKFPGIVGPPKSDICFATQNRQDAVTELANQCDVIIICGSRHSSNSNRLKETAEKTGNPSYLIDSVEEFDPEWIRGKEKVGISSGASVPEYIVQTLVSAITAIYPDTTVYRKDSVEKDIRFTVPKV